MCALIPPERYPHHKGTGQDRTGHKARRQHDRQRDTTTHKERDTTTHTTHDDAQHTQQQHTKIETQQQHTKRETQ